MSRRGRSVSCPAACARRGPVRARRRLDDFASRAPAAPELQLWLCAGAGAPDRAVALAERFAPAMPVRMFVVSDRPSAAPAGVEVLADPALRVHGRLGAVSDTAYVVRPDGHLGFRCEPPDGEWLTCQLRSIGVRTPAGPPAA